MATALKLAGSLLAAAQSVSADAVDDLNVREHIANVAKIAAGFGAFAGSDENAVTLITDQGAESWPRTGKDMVARRLAERIAGALA